MIYQVALYCIDLINNARVDYIVVRQWIHAHKDII
jgi:hypothetical protein